MHKYDVLRLYVSMQDLVFVHQANCVKKVPNYERSTILRQSLSCRYDVVELPIASQLEYSIEVFLISEVSVSFDDIWMI